MTALVIDPFKTGVLDKDRHSLLVDDIDRVVGDAGIERKWLWTSMKSVCRQPVIDWVRRYQFHVHEGKTGLMVVGKSDNDAVTQMSAIAGALTRNFIHARVMTLSNVLDEVQAGGSLTMSCLLIPNFYDHADGVPEWRRTMLYDFMLSRTLAGSQTVINASNQQGMMKHGKAVYSHIVDHYEVVEI